MVLPTLRFFLQSVLHKALSFSSYSKKILTIGLYSSNLLLLVLLLAACGPASAKDDNQQLTADTHRIALDFQASHNVEEARTRLSQLQVANSSQWLVYVTESAISSNDDANTTTALVTLAQALGLPSADIIQYAQQHNLLPTAMPTVNSTPVVNVATLPQPITATVPAAAPAAPVTVVTTQQALTVTMSHTNSPSTTVAITTTRAASVTAAMVTTATNASTAKPLAKAKDALNVRSGPGVDYNLVSALQSGESLPIVGKNNAGDWWEVVLANSQMGWVYSQLVEISGNTTVVAVAADIPPPPPTATPAPVVQAPTATPQATNAPAASASDTPRFSLAAKRMWSKAENGDCRGQHLLRLHVVDANGAPLNGVTLQGIYTGATFVTGSQGKGDGLIEYDLYSTGEGFKVITNNDGRQATSDNAEGFTTDSRDIDEATLIAGGYCSSHEDCQVFYSSFGCKGHHSWEATLKRNY
jgi:uncharacterized protein YraI